MSWYSDFDVLPSHPETVSIWSGKNSAYRKAANRDVASSIDVGTASPAGCEGISHGTTHLVKVNSEFAPVYEHRVDNLEEPRVDALDDTHHE